MSGEVIDLMTHPAAINREIGKNYRRNLLERVNGQFDSQIEIMKANTQRASELADRIDSMMARLAAGDESVLCGHAHFDNQGLCITCGKKVKWR